MLRQKFRNCSSSKPSFAGDGEAELAFVSDLVRRITQDGWGPVGLWREMQAHCERAFQRESKAAQTQLAGA